MTLESKVISVRDLPAGEPVGYGARYSTERSQRIGVVAMGYADGYPRHAADGTLVFIDGNPGRLVGRVSMDMLTVDLTDHPQAGWQPGRTMGPERAGRALAAQFGSIPYQLLCNLKRVPRVYSGA